MPSQSVAGEVTSTWSLTGFPPTKMARAEKWTSAVVDNLRCFIFCCVVSSGPPSSACLGGRGALHTHFIHPHCPSPVCKPKQSAALSWTIFILAIPTNEKVVKKGIYLYVYKNTHLPVCVCVCVCKKKKFFAYGWGKLFWNVCIWSLCGHTSGTVWYMVGPLSSSVFSIYAYRWSMEGLSMCVWARRVCTCCPWGEALAMRVRVAVIWMESINI